MFGIKERVNKVMSKMEKIIFRHEERALEHLRKSVEEHGGTFDEAYLRKVADIYLTSIKTLTNQFKRQYPKSVKVIGASFIEVSEMLCRDIRERGNTYLERFGIFFLDAEADPEKYAELYMELADHVRDEYKKVEAEVVEVLGEHVKKEQRKKDLEKLTYVGWAVAAIIGMYFVFYFGTKSDWSFDMDKTQEFSFKVKEIETKIEEENLDDALKKSDDLLDKVIPEKQPYDYAQLKKMQGDIFVKFSSMMKDRAERAAELAKAAEAYQSALQAVPMEKAPVKSAGLNRKLGEACLNIPQIEQQGGSLTDMLGQYGSDGEALMENSQNVMSLVDQEAYIERSIEAFKQSLSVYDDVRWPTENAIMHVNLGTAYAMLSQMKQRIPNIRKAMIEFKAGVAYFDKERYPLTFSIITNNIGVAYYYLSDFGMIDDLHENAVKALNVAITTLERKGCTHHVYEVKLNAIRMEQQVRAMEIFRDMDMSPQTKRTMLASLGEQFAAEEASLTPPDPARPDTCEAYEVEFMLLGISKMKL